MPKNEDLKTICDKKMSDKLKRNRIFQLSQKQKELGGWQ